MDGCFNQREGLKGGANHLRWFVAILFIILGAILWSLTIDQMGMIGHIIMKIIGLGCIILPGVFIRRKKGENNRDRNT
jgi:uncharacterized membrane protein